MSSICFAHTRRGQEWTTYVRTSLHEQNPQLTISTFNISGDAVPEAWADATLKVVLVSPDVGKWITPSTPWLTNVPVENEGKYTGVCILCNVDRQRFDDMTRSQPVLIDWTVLNVESTEKSVDRVVQSLLRLYADAISKSGLGLKPKSRHDLPPPLPRRPSKHGSIDSDDGPPTPKHTENIHLFPSTVYEPSQVVVIAFTDAKASIWQDVNITVADKAVDIAQINPLTYSFVTPDLPPGETMVDIYSGDILLCQHKLLYSSIDYRNWTCYGFLCQSLGVDLNDRQKVDAKLTEKFEESVPVWGGHGIFSDINIPSGASTSDVIFPTILHFAAYHGLAEFCARLLDAPGATAAYQIENSDHDIPPALAKKAGHAELADFMLDFMEMKLTVDTYVSMCGNVQAVPSTNGETHGVEPPDELYDYSYIHPPASPSYLGIAPNFAKHSLVEQDYSNVELLKPVVPPDLLHRVSAENALPLACLDPKKPPTLLRRDVTPPFTPSDYCQPVLIVGGNPPGPAAMGSRSMQELIDINTLVRDDRESVTSAQRLFKAWNTKYAKGSRSFFDRQAALQHLRVEFQGSIDTVEMTGPTSAQRDKISGAMKRIRATRLTQSQPNATRVANRQLDQGANSLPTRLAFPATGWESEEKRASGNSSGSGTSSSSLSRLSAESDEDASAFPPPLPPTDRQPLAQTNHPPPVPMTKRPSRQDLLSPSQPGRPLPTARPDLLPPTPTNKAPPGRVDNKPTVYSRKK